MWVEIFKNTPKGQKAIEKMKSATATYLCIISVAELTSWAERNNADSVLLMNSIAKTSTYLDINYDILREAGIDYNKFRKEKPKISMVDSIIYTTARMHGLGLLTCDRDFEGLPGVELL